RGRGTDKATTAASTAAAAGKAQIKQEQQEASEGEEWSARKKVVKKAGRSTTNQERPNQALQRRPRSEFLIHLGVPLVAPLNFAVRPLTWKSANEQARSDKR